MDSKSTNLYFLSSFRGLGYFLSHPRLWFLAFLAVFILSVVLLGIFVFVVILAWPPSVLSFGHKLWDIFKAVGLGTAGVLVGFVILMPLIVTLALDKMVRKLLSHEEGKVVEVGFFKSIYSSTVIFFKTFFWRLFWPIVGIFSALFLGPIGAFISQMGIGHLAVIDGVDLALALKGLGTKRRVDLYRDKRGAIFVVGFFSAILSMALSITILGWFLWVPAVFCGTALWVKDWPELRSSGQ